MKRKTILIIILQMFFKVVKAQRDTWYNVQPMQLDTQQIAQFDRDGFLLLRQFATDDEVSALKHAALMHAKASQAPIETEAEYNFGDPKHDTIRRLRQLYDRDERFATWMRLPRIRPILEQLLRDQVILTRAHHNSLMTKMPHHSTQSDWHQDKRYWHFSDDNLISVWLALDAETMQNGVLEFIPGSHRANFSADAFDERGFFLHGRASNDAWIAKRIHFDLNAGDVLLFHCKTLHRADKNSSDQPKYSVVYTVHAQATKPIAGSRSAAYSEIELFKI